jgi:hypothetical protein
MSDGGPMVALDWSWVRARGGAALPAGNRYVVPECFFGEAASSSVRGATVRIVYELCAANRAVLFVAPLRARLFELEPAPDSVMDRGVLASQPAAGFFPPAVFDEEERFAKHLQRSHLPRELADDRAWFEKVSGHLVGDLEVAAAAQGWSFKGPTRDSVESFASNLPFMGDWAARVEARYRSPAWRAALNATPDRYAAGRYARLMVWNGARRLRLGAGARAGADRDAVEYAFLASCCDEYWTGDTDLARCVGGLFPSVKVGG